MTGSSVIRERRPGSGVWEVRVYTGRDAAGRVTHKSRTVHGGKRKAEDMRRTMLAEVKAGKLRASKGSVAFLFDKYLAHLEANDKSPSTLRVYRSYVRRHIIPRFGTMDMLDVTPKMLDDFYAALRSMDPPRKPSTIRQYHAIMSGAFRQAVKWGWVEKNPADNATPPKIRRAEVTSPTRDQVVALIRLAEDRNPTLATMLYVAATTGARRGELCALRWSMIDLDRGVLVISESIVEPKAGEWHVKGTKTDKVGRLALDRSTVATLVKHRNDVLEKAASAGVELAPDAFVFSQVASGSQPYKPDRVSGFFRRLCNAADMPGMKLHHLRRFVATQGLASGADVRTVAGRLRHDATMTLNVYSALIPELDRGLADHMGELLSGSSS